MTWPFNVPNETATYQLYFIATASGSDIANSGNFNLTLPPGENRTAAEGTVGPYGTHPDSDNPPSATPKASDHLSKGAIAGIAIGAISALVVGGLAAGLFIYRRRHPVTGDGDSDVVKKAELDGGSTSRRDEKRETFQSMSEIGSSDKPPNYLKFELPSSPPQPPVELPDNEIPAFEMSSGGDMPKPSTSGDGVSEERGSLDVVDSTTENPTDHRNMSLDSNRKGDHTLHSRDFSIGSGSTTSAKPLPSGPNSPDSGSLRSFSTTSPSPRRLVSFAEALEAIVAEELRRKGPEE